MQVPVRKSGYSKASKTKEKKPRRVRGIYEKVNGSGQWWIRYADTDGKIRREVAGTRATALHLYKIRKTEVLQGKKLPVNLRLRPVLFSDLASDALAYSRLHKKTYSDD